MNGKGVIATTSAACKDTEKHMHTHVPQTQDGDKDTPQRPNKRTATQPHTHEQPSNTNLAVIE